MEFHISTYRKIYTAAEQTVVKGKSLKIFNSCDSHIHIVFLSAAVKHEKITHDYMDSSRVPCTKSEGGKMRERDCGKSSIILHTIECLFMFTALLVS